MKTFPSIILLVGLVAVNHVFPQGTTYISNLGQASAGSAVVARDAWIAVPFITGHNPGGYFLNSIDMLMGQASGSASGFSVSVYDNVVRTPGSSLLSLSGSDPTAGGTFSYDGSALSISSSTLYFVVVTAATPAAQGSYSWNYASSTAFSYSDSWSRGPTYYTSTDGSSWTSHLIQEKPFQFAINATAVPEPSIVALLALGTMTLAWVLRKRARKSWGIHLPA